MLPSRGMYRKTCLRFKKEDKADLIAAVRARRLLWDIKHSGHNDLISIKEAWKSVGSELSRDPQECKIAWRSLRQSYRYHCRTAPTRFKLDGDEIMGEADPLGTSEIQWEFADDMSFLQEMGRKDLFTVKHFNPGSDVVQSDDASTTPTVLDECDEYVDTEYLNIAYDISNYEDDVDDYTLKSTESDVPKNPALTLANNPKNQMMPTENVPCRTCAQPLNYLNAQNLFLPENQKLLFQIKVITDLTLEQDELFSDFICESCLKNLELATEFRRVCIESQTHALIKVQIKEEDMESECMTYQDSTVAHSPSTTDVAIEEERLEEIDISEDNYCDEIDIQPISSPPRRPKKNGQASNHKYQCHECGLTFTRQDLLKMHMHEAHDMQLHTRFVCKHCGHDFQYSAPLVEHLKSIGVHFAYKCEECKQNFHSRHFLKKHMRRVHGQADEHICHMCGKNFTTGFNLRNHIVRHSGTRPHKCQLCKAAFSTTAELNNHQRTHDNVRPYPCRYGCGKSFRHCSNRSTHERVHMAGNLRPFQCDYCDKTFVTKGDCRAHQMVHTMSRDFSCEICEQSFKLQKHYIQHLTTKSHKKVEEHLKLMKEIESKELN